jgi:hypothetical protein
MRFNRHARSGPARRTIIVAVFMAATLTAGIIVGCDDSTSPRRSAAIVGTVVDSAGAAIANALIGISYVIPGYSIDLELTAIDEPPPFHQESGTASWSALAAPVCSLGMNFPNPLWYGTNFPLELDAESAVRLTILDAGRDTVTTAADTTLAAGRHLLGWRIEPSEYLPYGPYIAHLAVTHGDTTCTSERRVFRQPPAPASADFADGELATTSILGRFALPMDELAVGEAVTITDVTGAVLGTSAVIDSVEVCAYKGTRFGCAGVWLGQGILDVPIEIVLPIE